MLVGRALLPVRSDETSTSTQRKAHGLLDGQECPSYMGDAPGRDAHNRREHAMKQPKQFRRRLRGVADA